MAKQKSANGLFALPESVFHVPFDGKFSLECCATTPEAKLSGSDAKRELGKIVERLYEHQRALYAEDRRAVLCVFQAMDAAGKDSTIRTVFSGVNPAGFQVFAFKQPSKEELDHDFLWRSAVRLPERGRFGVFNRSYYEETLVVRVHPEYLAGQRLPRLSNPPTKKQLERLWKERFASIRDHEEHLARNGTVILKFFLNVSQQEQHRRFLSRLEEPDKHWKFSEGDLAESKHWPAYMHAYQEALAATSRPWAPWYAVPADDKPTMRVLVADILDRTLQEMKPTYPAVDGDEKERLEEIRAQLAARRPYFSAVRDPKS